MPHPLNRAHITFHLTEAKEAIEELLKALQTEEYDHGEYFVEMSHLYHHVNTAWNARAASQEAVERCSEADFERWRQMPPTGELLL